ncbi:uncharacterized protein O9250_014412 [Rhynochetos jubatus]
MPTTPLSGPAGDGEGDGAAGTTFPSGSSRGCTCSVRLPAAPGKAPGAAQSPSARLPRRLPGRLPRRLPRRLPAAAGGSRQTPGAPSGAHGRAPVLGPAVPILPAGLGPSFAPAATLAPGSMPRGRAWTPAEVSSLLELVEASGEAALLMASTSRPNEALWREISRGLAAAGYGRSVAQCRSKWKALKQAFHSERETRRRAGCHSPRLPPHYRAMKSIWKAAGRPVFGERRMPDLAKPPARKRRSAHAARSPSSPEPPGTHGLRRAEWGSYQPWGGRFPLSPEHDVGGDAPGVLLSSPLLGAKDEPESSAGGDDIAGVPPAPPAMPHAGCYFPPFPLLGCHTTLKQERAEQKAGFPGETSPGMGRGNQALPGTAAALGFPATAATSEQLALGEEASHVSLHGSGMAGLLQSVQQLLVQILQTSRQQQALLERLASDTVSHLHFLSHSLVQVGETLHQLLLRPQTHLGHYASHMSLFEGGSGMPCSPGSPHTSPDHKEEAQLSPADGCTPL